MSDLRLFDKSKPQTRPAHTQNVTDDSMLEIFEKSFASGKSEPASVFVNNIPTDAKLQMLNVLFPSAGSIQLPMGADGSNMGYAIVEFSSLTEARDIVKQRTLYTTKIGINCLNLHVIGEEEVEKAKQKEPTKCESKSNDAKRPQKESGGRPAASVDKRMEIKKGYNVLIANIKRDTPSKEVMECLVKEMRERGICSHDENPIIHMKVIRFRSYQFAVFESPSKAQAAIKQLDKVVEFKGQKLTLKEGQNLRQLKQETKGPAKGTKGPAKDSAKDGTLNERQGRKESNQTDNRKRKLDGSVGRKDPQTEVKKPKVKVPPTKKKDSPNLSANGKPLTNTKKRIRGKIGQAAKQKQQAELKSNPSSKSTPQNKPTKSAQDKQQTAVKSTSRNQSTRKSLNTGNQRSTSNSTPRNGSARRSLGNQRSTSNSTPRNQPARRSVDNQRPSSHSTPRNQPARSASNQRSSRSRDRSTSNSTPRNQPTTRPANNRLSFRSRDWALRRSGDSSRNHSYNALGLQSGGLSTLGQLDPLISEQILRASLLNSGLTGGNLLGGCLSTLGLPNPVLSGQNFPRDPSERDYPDIARRENMYRNDVAPIKREQQTSGEMARRDRYIEAMDTADRYHSLGAKDPLYSREQRAVDSRESRDLDLLYPRARDPLDSRAREPRDLDPLYPRDRNLLDSRARELRDLDPLYPRARDPLDSRAREPRDLDPLNIRARDPLDPRAREPRDLDPLYPRARDPLDSRAREPRDLDPLYPRARDPLDSRAREPRDLDPLNPRARDPLDSRGREPRDLDPLYPRARDPLDSRAREPRDLDPLYPRAHDPLDSRAREPRDLDSLYPRAHDPLDSRAREPRDMDPRAHDPVDSRAMGPRDLVPYYPRETRDVDPQYLRAQDSLDSRAREPQAYGANNPSSMDMVGASQVQLLIDQLTKAEMERSGDLPVVGDSYDRRNISDGSREDTELLITNVSSDVDFKEIRKFLNQEMKQHNLCGSKELPLKWLDRFDRHHLHATFNTASQANYALQTLHGILYKGRPMILKRKTEEQKKRETGTGHIYVGNLPLDFDKKQLTDLVNKEFVRKGLCRPHEVPVKYVSDNNGKPFCFMKLANPQLAIFAVTHLNGLIFEGKQLRLGPAKN